MKRWALIGALVAVAAFAAPNIVGNLLRLHSVANASLPAPSTLNTGGLFFDSSYLMPAWSNGTIWQYGQGSLAQHDWSCVFPNTGVTLTSFGIVPTTVGTLVNSGGGPNAFLTPTLHRFAIATSAALNNSAEVYGETLPYWRGNLAGLGGFIFLARVSTSATLPARIFIGLAELNIVGVVQPLPGANPSALLNTVYVGADDTDTNLAICSNDGAGAATCTTLGASFPITTAGLGSMDIMLYAAPNASSISYFVKVTGGAATASGTLSADLPVSTTYMAPHIWANNATSLAAAQTITSRFCVVRPL